MLLCDTRVYHKCVRLPAKLASFAPCFSLSFLSETIFAQTPLSLILCLTTLKKGKPPLIFRLCQRKNIFCQIIFAESEHQEKQVLRGGRPRFWTHFTLSSWEVQDVPTLIPKHRAYKSPFWTGKVTCVCEIELRSRFGGILGTKRQLG